MKKIIAAISLMIVMSSCMTVNQAKLKYGCKEVEVKEKTDTIEVVRTVTELIPGDSVTVFIPCDNPEPEIKVKGKGNSSATAKYNTSKRGYEVTANCDSLEVKLLAKDKIINTYRETILKQLSKEQSKNWIQRKVSGLWDYTVNILAIIGFISVIIYAFRILLPKYLQSLS